MPLGVEIGEVGDDPPSILVGCDVPDFVNLAEHDLSLDSLNVLYRLVSGLPMNVVSDVHLRVRISLDAVAAELAGWNGMRVHEALILRNCSALFVFSHDPTLREAERPKLSDPAHGTQRLQPRRSRRVR